MVHRVERRRKVEQVQDWPRIDGDGRPNVAVHFKKHRFYAEVASVCWLRSRHCIYRFKVAEIRACTTFWNVDRYDRLDTDLILVLQILTIHSNLLQNRSNYCPFECFRKPSPSANDLLMNGARIWTLFNDMWWHRIQAPIFTVRWSQTFYYLTISVKWQNI